MALHVAKVSIELIQLLRPLVERIRRRDRSLADQIARAASSVALNIGEADRSQGGNVLARFHSAAGSASEPEWTESSSLDGVHGGLRPERSEGAPKAQ